MNEQHRTLVLEKPAQQALAVTADRRDAARLSQDLLHPAPQAGIPSVGVQLLAVGVNDVWQVEQPLEPGSPEARVHDLADVEHLGTLPPAFPDRAKEQP